jgi:hypothetical protein
MDAEGIERLWSYWNTIDRRLRPRRARSRQEKYTESHLTRKWVALINCRSGNEALGLLVCEPRRQLKC